MTISASQVMELRSATGAGMMDCKKALEESGGDMEKARDYLRKKGIALAAKRSDRETTEGGIAIAQSDDKHTAAMVRLACETDFVSRNEQFQGLLGQITGQVLAAGDADVLSQPVVNGEGTVENLITTAVGVIGENIQLVEAARISVTGQGMVSGYVHTNGKIGVLVALQTQGAPGDLAALEQLGRDVAMHIAASNVAAVSEAQIDPAVLEKEREVFIAQAQESGKSADIAEKMVQGRLKKFVKEISLLDQPFVKDPDKSVSAVLAEAGKAQGTAVAVEQFIKFQF